MAANWSDVSMSGGNWPFRYAFADLRSSSEMPFSCRRFSTSSVMSRAFSVFALLV